jgi:NADH-quinone oxidoreductase subunit L
MTVPLMVLGVLAVVGGLINLPTFARGHHWLETWLEPVLAPAAAIMPVHLPHGATEYALIGAAVVIAILGLWAGYRSTVSRPIPVARDAPEEVGFAKVLYHKYYIDEIYHGLIVRPLVGISRILLWKFVDQGVIDGVGVNGTGGLARGLGWLGGRLQTGQLGFYLVIFVIGAVWLLHAVIR